MFFGRPLVAGSYGGQVGSRVSSQVGSLPGRGRSLVLGSTPWGSGGYGGRSLPMLGGYGQTMLGGYGRTMLSSGRTVELGGGRTVTLGSLRVAYGSRRPFY